MNKKLYRSKSDKKLFGVLGGIAAYLDVDAVLVRVITVVLSFFLPTIPVYIICALVMPEEPEIISGQAEYRQADYTDFNSQNQ